MLSILLRVELGSTSHSRPWRALALGTSHRAPYGIRRPAVVFLFINHGLKALVMVAEAIHSAVESGLAILLASPAHLFAELVGCVKSNDMAL